MKREMVIIKHLESPCHYLFLVPEYSFCVKAGRLVLCDTRKGPQYGVCLCDSFDADDEMMCRYFGTEPDRMRYVTAVFEQRDLNVPKKSEENNDDTENGQPE